MGSSYGSFFARNKPAIISVSLVAAGVALYFDSAYPLLGVCLFLAGLAIPAARIRRAEARRGQAVRDGSLAKLEASGFTTSQKLIRGALPVIVSSGPTPALLIDEASEKVCFFSDYPASGPRIFGFDDLVSSEIIEDGASITTTRTSRGSQLIGAAVGSLIAGPVGLIVGGLSGKTVGTTSSLVTRIELRIIVNDTRQPSIVVPFLTTQRSRSEPLYANIRRDMERWHETVSVLIRRADMKRAAASAQPASPAVSAVTVNSIADELKKLAELRAAGVLTEGEFVAQKQRLLGGT